MAQAAWLSWQWGEWAFVFRKWDTDTMPQTRVTMTYDEVNLVVLAGTVDSIGVFYWWQTASITTYDISTLCTTGVVCMMLCCAAVPGGGQVDMLVLTQATCFVLDWAHGWAHAPRQALSWG